MRKLKNIITAFACLMLCFLTTVQVSAANPDGHVCSHGYHTFSDHKMSYGVGNYGNNRRYYWATGFSSTYNSYISNAVSEWVNTSPVDRMLPHQYLLERPTLVLQLCLNFTINILE